MRTTLATHVLENSEYSRTPTSDSTIFMAGNHTRNVIIAVNIKLAPLLRFRRLCRPALSIIAWYPAHEIGGSRLQPSSSRCMMLSSLQICLCQHGDGERT